MDSLTKFLGIYPATCFQKGLCESVLAQLDNHPIYVHLVDSNPHRLEIVAPSSRFTGASHYTRLKWVAWIYSTMNVHIKTFHTVICIRSLICFISSSEKVYIYIYMDIYIYTYVKWKNFCVKKIRKFLTTTYCISHGWKKFFIFQKIILSKCRASNHSFTFI